MEREVRIVPGESGRKPALLFLLPEPLRKMRSARQRRHCRGLLSFCAQGLLRGDPAARPVPSIPLGASRGPRARALRSALPLHVQRLIAGHSDSRGVQGEQWAASLSRRMPLGSLCSSGSAGCSVLPGILHPGSTEPRGESEGLESWAGKTHAIASWGFLHPMSSSEQE